MSKHLSGVLVAVFAAAMLYPAPAFADHRPGNVVVVGGSWPFTGHYSESAKTQLIGRQLYVEELNTRGGLLGHKVELRLLDDKSDRRNAIRIYEKLVTEKEVDLFIGPYASHLTDAVGNVMERYKQTFVTPGTSPAIFQRGRKYIFSLPTVNAQDRQIGALQLAKQIGIRRIAVIGTGELFGRQATEGALRWAKMLALEVVLVESYRKDQKDFAAVLRRAKASGAEAIISNSYYFDAVAQIRQLRELDINVKLFSATLGPISPKFVDELGGTAEYVLGPSNWEPKLILGHPGIKEFIESYEKSYGEKPTSHASAGWVNIQILEAAVKESRSFDSEKLRHALASITVPTIRGPWKANEQGLSTYGGLIIQIQNGERVIVWPAHQAEARFLPMPKWEDRAKK